MFCLFREFFQTDFIHSVLLCINKNENIGKIHWFNYSWNNFQFRTQLSWGIFWLRIIKLCVFFIYIMLFSGPSGVLMIQDLLKECSTIVWNFLLICQHHPVKSDAWAFLMLPEVSSDISQECLREANDLSRFYSCLKWEKAIHLRLDDIWYTICQTRQVVFVFPIQDNNFMYENLFLHVFYNVLYFSVSVFSLPSPFW